MFIRCEEEEQPILESEVVEDDLVVVQTIEIPEIVHTGFIGRFFPFGFFYELKMLLRLAFPVTITSLISFLSGPISLIFCGHLGKEALATVGLAISVFNVTGLAVVTGLLTAADTLFAQTYGSNAKIRMGEQLQRTLVIITICCFPCVTLHVMAGPLLLALKQNPVISKAAGEYLFYMSPGLLFAAYVQSFTKYVQTQNYVYPPMVIGIITNGLNALLHYLLLFVFNIGIVGSAISQVISYLIQAVVLVCFIIFLERCGDRIHWNGWTAKLWYEWGGWFKLALPGVVMITLEWTLFEIGSIVAGTLGKEELATQSILFNIEGVCFTLLPMGFGIATSIRVGQFLGSKSAVGPRSVISVALVSLWVTSIIFVAFIFLMRWELPKIFNNDERVIEMTANLLPVIAAFQIFDGTVGVCSGACRGAGLQLAGAVNCFITLYMIAAPLALCLVFLRGEGLRGLWIGFTVGTVTQALVYLALTQCINWNKQVALANARTGGMNSIQSNSSTEPNVEPEKPKEKSDDVEDHVIDILANRAALATDLQWQPSVPERKRIVIKRLALIIPVLLLFATCVCIRALLPWSDIFQGFCIFPNDTFISISKQSAGKIANCTYVTI